MNPNREKGDCGYSLLAVDDDLDFGRLRLLVAGLNGIALFMLGCYDGSPEKGNGICLISVERAYP